MSKLSPDLCITAAYGGMLPQRFLDIPRLGTLNIHPSLLPKWVHRGAWPETAHSVQASTLFNTGSRGSRQQTSCSSYSSYSLLVQLAVQTLGVLGAGLGVVHSLQIQLCQQSMPPGLASDHLGR